MKNLGCFGDTAHALHLAPETVLVGPNNVGKSVMIGAYNFVRHFILEGSLPFDTTSYRWGSLPNISHRHDTRRQIQMGISFQNHHNADFSLEYMEGRAHANGSRDAPLQAEARKGWYFAPSRSEIPPNLQVGSGPQSTAWQQPLDPSGSNVITFLLERYTSRDPKWGTAEEWLKRIDPELSILKSPLRGAQGSVETEQAPGVDINMAYQGTGIQKVLTIIAGVVFSPEDATIVVEEPEVHLHPRSQEVLVDLFNKAVNEWRKQVIFTTHSWNMLLPFVSDVGSGSKRGQPHVQANPSNFKLVSFSRAGGDVVIGEIDLKGMEFDNLRARFKQLWG